MSGKPGPSECPFFDLDKPSENYIRICRLITTICSTLLRDILSRHIKPANLRNELDINRAKLERIMSNQQKEQIYLKAGSNQIYPKDLDISVLYMLLRNICSNITPPKNGWGKPLQKGDNGISACIERIRQIRNEIQAHSTNGKVSDTDFQNYWEELENLIIETEKKLTGDVTYQGGIIKIKDMTFTNEDAEKYKREFQQSEDPKESKPQDLPKDKAFVESNAKKPRCSPNFKLVAGIDFGTAYSGHAFSSRADFENDPLKIKAHKWSQSLLAHKTPTSALFDENKTLIAFGNEAEDRFRKLSDDGKHQDHYFFERFKMQLYNKSGDKKQKRLTKNSMIRDISGKELPALYVFSKAIEYMHNHLLNELKDQDGDEIAEENIHWVLTVPAIWDDSAKQFMRDAAKQAGINNDNLTIALEPEAASMYCKKIQLVKLMKPEAEFEVFSPGNQYLILDAGGDPVGMPCRMNVEFSAFDQDAKTPQRCLPMLGELYNTNTVDKFKECDKKEMISEAGKKIWDSIVSGKALDTPELLATFLLLTFADLKKYHYYYWFCFPCLCPSTDITVDQEPKKLKDKLTPEEMEQFLQVYDTFQDAHPTYQGIFVAVLSKGNIVVEDVKHMNKFENTQEVYFGFCDPSNIEDYPGWPLRNFLMLISYHWKGDLRSVNVLCLRDRSRDGTRDISHSLLLSLNVPDVRNVSECPKCVGWEKNEKQKLAPRFVNLSASMDPTRLAASAVDLNLKLMRWRLLPELDLDLISRTKCLLLGAGTLGCNVARCLMGWGVRTITLVDNGRVSYSNPVRQSLFQFEDCVKGGKPKAEAAAEAMKRIFPGVNAKGLSLSIPMPGHAVPDSAIEGVKKDVETLQDLVNSHDVVFLLLDTRESRWLPTLMAAEKQKIVICSALGFDTYLVMRHGVRSDTEGANPAHLSSYSSIPGDQLGCYFCNDVVAPGNSLKDRTLDQQCTVSRPGISYMASALAVELLVSILQHPELGRAPADTSASDEHLSKDFVCPLGLVPHQIRCFVSRFQQVLPACKAFDKCTACSKTVIEQFRRDGFDFLRRAFNDPSYLEDLTGLTQMHQETLDAEVWGFSDDEECSSMEASSS